jgi:hypothetical protein
MKTSTHPQVSKGAVEEKRPFCFTLLESPRGHGQNLHVDELLYISSCFLLWVLREAWHVGRKERSRKTAHLLVSGEKVQDPQEKPPNSDLARF